MSNQFSKCVILVFMSLASMAVFTPRTIAIGTGNCTVDADCNDGLDCNGSEVCFFSNMIGTCQSGTFIDCDSSGIADACEIEDGVLSDCDGNTVPDVCDIAGGATDCNANGVPDVCDLASRSIDQALVNLDNGVGADVSSLIPSPFDFTGGDSSDSDFCSTTNNNIGDGGNDMYDCGNFLSTNLASEFLYTDGNLVASDGIFGPGSSYHTSKFAGLFVMQADNISIDMFEITGNLGADGFGSQDTAVFNMTVAGRRLTVFVKRVFGTSDPSINHIIIVSGDGAGISHTFATDTNDDRDTLTGLSGNHITYLLVARTAGQRLSDADVLALVDVFDSGAGLSFSSDCNGNSIPDDCDITNGTSQDVDTNGTPDECQADCNNNNIPDRYEIGIGQAVDCNSNNQPDACDIEIGTSQDCNGNSIPDDCDITNGTSQDVDTNGTPDECQADCNNNNIPDRYEIGIGQAVDCNSNNQPDACDIEIGTSQDCNGNSIPDECNEGPDCNSNGNLDICDLNSRSNSQSLENLINGVGVDVSALIPTPFNFVGGDSSDNEFCGGTNNNILDGGNDMYDCGNYISTNLASQLLYTDGIVSLSDSIFGPGSNYFTAKFPALFVLQANNISINTFEITGDLGADGGGLQDTAMFDVTVLGQQFTVYVKRVFSIFDPSINHIIFVPGDGVGITHTFSTNTNEDLDTLSSLSGVNHLTYLLVARTNGERLDDADVLALVTEFQLGAGLSFGGDCNGNTIPDDCDIAAGTSQDVDLNSIPDDCQTDCNNNNIPDEFEIGTPQAPDCNNNGTPDKCDIDSQISLDNNSDGVPDECTGCPEGLVTFVNPADGAVDARQPHPIGDDTAAQGIDMFDIAAPAGADDPACWSLCETGTGNFAPNAIASVADNGNGTVTLTLNRGITSGEVTKIAYTSGSGVVTIGTFIAHPGNVNGDSTTNASDITALVDALNGVTPRPLHRTDLNRSNVFNASDLTRLIDLLNGANTFGPWLSTAKPAGTCTP